MNDDLENKYAEQWNKERDDLIDAMDGFLEERITEEFADLTADLTEENRLLKREIEIARIGIRKLQAEKESLKEQVRKLQLNSIIERTNHEPRNFVYSENREIAKRK